MIWRLMAAAIVCLTGSCGQRSDDEAAQRPSTLVIYSTTDTDVFRPVIDDFRRSNPTIQVSYVELDANQLYQRFLKESREGRHQADLLFSSAMDLQIKLVNDGYVVAHVSENGRKLPSWARWRDEAFGITFEPAVMVYNKNLLRGRTAPRSRPELLRALRNEPEFWRRRIGTYDVARSSVGYLLASQDARQNSDHGSLLEALGETDLQTSISTATLLDDIEQGKLVLGYNLLGSYARARVDGGSPLAIVYPADYTLAVSRTAVLPRNAPNEEAAHAFLEYLLSLPGQRALSGLSRLSASRPEIMGPYSQMGIAETHVGPLRPIPLGPGLLAYLDQQKQRRMIASWNRILDLGVQGDHMTGR